MTHRFMGFFFNDGQTDRRIEETNYGVKWDGRRLESDENYFKALCIATAHWPSQTPLIRRH